MSILPKFIMCEKCGHQLRPHQEDKDHQWRCMTCGSVNTKKDSKIKDKDKDKDDKPDKSDKSEKGNGWGRGDAEKDRKRRDTVIDKTTEIRKQLEEALWIVDDVSKNVDFAVAYDKYKSESLPIMYLMYDIERDHEQAWMGIRDVRTSVGLKTKPYYRKPITDRFFEEYTAYVKSVIESMKDWVGDIDSRIKPANVNDIRDDVLDGVSDTLKNYVKHLETYKKVLSVK